ncbi:MAG: Trk family potassium uptake protein [Clostridia bacterium]|nr:Trk family potassium uptake protein [Clostridia bacterium]
MKNASRNHLRRVKKKLNIKRRLSPTQVILFGFIALILIGTLLLTLPISSADGSFTSPKNALFTATSATCVTGLIVEDTGTHWSLFGQIVIICLIQIGGLGFMTMAVMMSIFIKRHITPRERLLVAQSLGLTGVGGTVQLVRRIVIGTFAVEGVGAVILATQFVPLFGWAKGIYYGIFHAISFFCNAGFDVLDGTNGYGGNFSSLTSLSDNYIIGITVMLLIIIGGIGFIVWDDLVNFIKERKQFSVYSKFVLAITAGLIVGGTLLLMLCEWNNPATIGNMSVGDKVFQCLFQAVTTRTAGVDMINNAAMTESSKLISMLLMFVGGASGSTAGGIKVGTFGVLLLAVLAFSRGDRELVVMKRKITHETISRALTVIGIDLLAVFAATLIITLTNTGVGVIDALYEAFSGIATVGLSLSLTPTLSAAAHFAIITLMFFGRVGILTITYSIMLRSAQKNSCISYPELNMMIG